MNKIFKIKQNSLGQSIVTSELAKSCGKGKTLAMAILSLLSIGVVNPALATSSTIGEGNLVTGEKGVTDGYNNIVTATKGTAQGNDAIATGNNLSRDEFSAKLNEHNALLSSKEETERGLATTETNIEVNEKTQNNLQNQIDDLNNIINRASNKSNQIEALNNQLEQKNTDLVTLQEALNNAKAEKSATSTTGSGDKTIWTDFTAQLGKLDWNKLSDTSDNITGVNKLATDLKAMVEADYPDFSERWDISKYEKVITGYINRQGLFDVNQDNIGTKLYKNILGTKSSYIFGLGDYFNYNTTLNKRAAHESSYNIVNYLENMNDISSNDFDIESIIDYDIDIYFTKSLDKDITPYISYYNLMNIIESENDNLIKDIAGKYNVISLTYHHQKAAGADSTNYSHVKSLLELPPIKENQKASVEFIYQNNLSYFVKNTFKNELASVNNGIISDQNTKAFISNTDIKYLRSWVSLFYDNFYNKVDLDASEENWLFDKDSYLRYYVAVAQRFNLVFLLHFFLLSL